MLIKDYGGLDEESIRGMSHDELIEAVLRIFKKVEYVKPCNYYENADLIHPDDIADAFRNRL